MFTFLDDEHAEICMKRKKSTLCLIMPFSILAVYAVLKVKFVLVKELLQSFDVLLQTFVYSRFKKADSSSSFNKFSTLKILIKIFKKEFQV